MDSAKTAGADISQAQSALSDAIFALNNGNFESALSQAKYSSSLIKEKLSGRSSAAAGTAANGSQATVSAPSSESTPAFVLACASLGIISAIGIAAFILKRKRKRGLEKI